MTKSLPYSWRIMPNSPSRMSPARCRSFCPGGGSLERLFEQCFQLFLRVDGRRSPRRDRPAARCAATMAPRRASCRGCVQRQVKLGARHGIGRKGQAGDIGDEIAGPVGALVGEHERVVGVKFPDDVVVGIIPRVDHGEPVGAGIAGAGQHQRQARGRRARGGEKLLLPVRPEVRRRRRSRSPARSSVRRRPAPGLPSTAVLATSRTSPT